MRLLLFLHFYQPYNQYDDILDRIIYESYYPITETLLNVPSLKVTANFAGCLTELLAKHGHTSLLDNIRQLVSRGQLDLVSSAMYHPILPLLPKKEILRQIELNDAINKKYFGSKYAPKGFFPPEMAVSQELLSILKEKGYEWCAVSENAFPDPTKFDNGVFYKCASTDISLLFRDKMCSALLISGQAQSGKEYYDMLKEAHASAPIFAVMDAETFGHHRVGYVQMLESIANTPELELLTAQELIVSTSNSSTESVTVRSSTWSNTEQDFWLDKEKKQGNEEKAFLLWNDPDNKVHQAQWKLTHLAIECFEKNKNPHTRIALDYALASDHFWWASAKPWWSLEMIEYGAYMLLDVIKLCGDKQDLAHAHELYSEILAEAFYLQRSGHIRKVHREAHNTLSMPPIKERTTAEWFNQLILEFEYEMKNAAARQNYELAIKWRDAISKITLGTDKYDVLHVVDDLWMSRTDRWGKTRVKPFLEHDWEEFSPFAKKHFLNVSTKEDFEKWKNQLS